MMIWETARSGNYSLLRDSVTIRDLVYLTIARNKLEEQKEKEELAKIKLFTANSEALITTIADIRKILFDSLLSFNSAGEAELYRLKLPSSAGHEQEMQSRLIIGRSRPMKKNENTTPDKD
jgi:hypothetical protein